MGWVSYAEDISEAQSDNHWNGNMPGTSPLHMPCEGSLLTRRHEVAAPPPTEALERQTRRAESTSELVQELAAFTRERAKYKASIDELQRQLANAMFEVAKAKAERDLIQGAMSKAQRDHDRDQRALVDAENIAYDSMEAAAQANSKLQKAAVLLWHVQRLTLSDMNQIRRLRQENASLRRDRDELEKLVMRHEFEGTKRGKHK